MANRPCRPGSYISKCTYLEGVDTDEQPSKNSCVFIDCKQSDDPSETKERQDDDESPEQVPACAQWIQIAQRYHYMYPHKECHYMCARTVNHSIIYYTRDGILVFESYANGLNVLLASMLQPWFLAGLSHDHTCMSSDL